MNKLTLIALLSLLGTAIIYLPLSILAKDLFPNFRWYRKYVGGSWYCIVVTYTTDVEEKMIVTKYEWTNHAIGHEIIINSEHYE